ncbi:MAG: cytochrome c [Dehalococcoidia bacterium]
MRWTLLLAGLLTMGLLLAACEEEPAGEDPTQEPAAEEPTATEPTAGEPTSEATAPPDGGGAGDATEGEAIFTGQAGGVTPGCPTCHSVGQGDIVGPDLEGVATRAQGREPGTSAEEYMRQSIVDPDAFVVPGFPQGVMPPVYGDQLDEEQLNNLVAYLMSLE